MVAARASRGVKLRTVRDQVGLDPRDVLELRKHVLRVEHAREALCDSGSDYSDQEDQGVQGFGNSFLAGVFKISLILLIVVIDQITFSLCHFCCCPSVLITSRSCGRT